MNNISSLYRQAAAARDAAGCPQPGDEELMVNVNRHRAAVAGRPALLAREAARYEEACRAAQGLPTPVR